MVKKTTSNPWTTEQLVHMSQSLATAYGTNIPSNIQASSIGRWNTQQLLNLSVAKSFPLD
ncbi:hypothetical protein IQ260_14250 [Leptolyngbya cf. ectocarpi LEGE 11479]|uniref:Uncharacterized protein n=1 Tax=Leptolyngbya cf. ectocarpi LEGE 11479 TaxID=1828722 RepID=A0A928ZUR3_LEPEC|nr:hypothetical protein [Leptolyngbya ectocarpi]MBE9067814.1 hypothetical protein [Leptolyngbya cf. ectocarpi LEGE 11479]